MKNFIREIPDFPKSGIVFRDIFPLLQNCFTEVIDDLSRKIKPCDYIAGIESRGFIFAAALAYKLNKGFIPIRKKGKLPPPVASQKIELEYGCDEIEMKVSESEYPERIVIIDDVMATGGTMKGAVLLANECNYRVVQAVTLINIPSLNRANLMVPFKSLFDYE